MTPEYKRRAGIAVLIVLVIAVVYYEYRRKHKSSVSGFAVGADELAILPTVHSGGSNPYTVLNQQLDAERGIRNDGRNQADVYRRAIGRYHEGAARADRIAEAEREQWYAATAEASHTAPYNPERGNDTASDVMQAHLPGPAFDHDQYITDLIVDPRTRENHEKWVEEMRPYSGGPMMVDTLDLEPNIDFRGLRRPQAVAQNNPMQITEIGPEDLIGNPKFNFRG